MKALVEKIQKDCIALTEGRVSDQVLITELGEKIKCHEEKLKIQEERIENQAKEIENQAEQIENQAEKIETLREELVYVNQA